jgi:hypothetical protein
MKSDPNNFYLGIQPTPEGFVHWKACKFGWQRRLVRNFLARIEDVYRVNGDRLFDLRITFRGQEFPLERVRVRTLLSASGFPLLIFKRIVALPVYPKASRRYWMHIVGYFTHEFQISQEGKNLNDC